MVKEKTFSSVAVYKAILHNAVVLVQCKNKAAMNTNLNILIVLISFVHNFTTDNSFFFYAVFDNYFLLILCYVPIFFVVCLKIVSYIMPFIIIALCNLVV